MTRAALELAADITDNGTTELTILIHGGSTPRCGIASCTIGRRRASRTTLGNMPHCNVTIIPYHLGQPDGMEITTSQVELSTPASYRGEWLQKDGPCHNV